MSYKIILTSLLATSFLWSCDSGSGNKEVDNYDVIPNLKNVADNIIVNRYKNLSTECESLKLAAAAFNTTSDQANLDALQTTFNNAYLAWQNVSAFQFGYAKTYSFRGMYNTFPTDTAEIKSIFAASSPNLEQASYIDATGFPGLDYVLFSENDVKVLERFNSSTNKEGAKNYLIGVATNLSNQATAAFNYWKNNSDGFRTTFSTSEEKSVGSPFSDFVNEFVWDVEFMKNYQLSYPAGKYTLNIARPELTEAIFSKSNLALFKEHILALERLYKGEDEFGTNGKGFDNYLLALGTEKNGVLLNTLILEQFALVQTKIDLLDGDLINAINTQETLINELFLESKRLVSYFKVDMCTAFNVQITFTDNDGD